MKRPLIPAILSALLVVAVTMSNVQAAPISTHMDEVSLFASNPDGTLDLTAYNLAAPAGAELQYGTDGDFRTVTDKSISINADWSRIFFQLVLPDHTIVNDGELSFSGGSDSYFTTVSIEWDYNNCGFDLMASEGSTCIASVPIPAPALLLCTGVIGMIVYRRRTGMSV